LLINLLSIQGINPVGLVRHQDCQDVIVKIAGFV
jgi:hypothetical protein